VSDSEELVRGCLQEVIGMIFMISVNQFSFLNFGADFPKLKYSFSFLDQFYENIRIKIIKLITFTVHIYDSRKMDTSLSCVYKI
jgi:hypothetical protein